MNNKENLQYFENKTMRGLFDDMKEWQGINQKRLLSNQIQKDGDLFTCIALTNPTEVVLCTSTGKPLRTFNGEVLCVQTVQYQKMIVVKYKTYDELMSLVAEFRTEHRSLTDDELDKLVKKTFKIDQATLRELDGVSDLIQSNE